MQAVVITGLAQGIGREVAMLLARSKVPVAGFDVDKEGIESLDKELEAAGCDHLLMTLDIADRPGILHFRDEVLEKFGRADVVLSNVGIGFFGPFEEVDLEKALKCMEINVIGTMFLLETVRAHNRDMRFVFCSTNKVYGENPNTVYPIEELETRYDYEENREWLSLMMTIPLGRRSS